MVESISDVGAARQDQVNRNKELYLGESMFQVGWFQKESTENKTKWMEKITICVAIKIALFRVPIADIFLSRKKRQISSDKNTAKSDPNLLTPKTVKIAAKINVATPPVEESTSAYVRDTIPTLSTETTKASPQVTGVTTDRKPKVVAVDIEEDEDPKNPFSSYDYKESKQGNSTLK